MQIPPQINPADPANPDTDQPLKEFAHRLAGMHTLGSANLQKSALLEDLQVWELALRKANVIFKAVPPKDAPVSRAGEWMLDNFYIVKQTLRQIEEDLPASFLNQLPILRWKLALSRQRQPGLSRNRDTLVFLRWRVNGSITARVSLTYLRQLTLFCTTSR